MPAPVPADPSARLRGALLWLAALSPALPLAWLVASHAVDVPVWDDWERTHLLQAWRAGTLGWADLYAPHRPPDRRPPTADPGRQPARRR